MKTPDTRGKGRRLGLLLIVLLLAHCGKKSPVVASVDGTAITAEQVRVAMQLDREKYDPALVKEHSNSAAFRNTTLHRLIEETILLNEAKRQGVTVSETELDDELKRQKIPLAETEKILTHRGVSLHDWKKNQRQRMIIRRLIIEAVVKKIPVSSDEIAAYYRQHQQDFYQPTQFHARQIIVDTLEQAEQLRDRLERGEDFSKLAEEFSQSPDRTRGGDLGWFDAGTAPQQFSEICARLKPGETSGVVVTDYGYQIFQLLSLRPSRQRPLDEVKGIILDRLREKPSELAVAQWSEALRTKAKVSIDEKALEGVKFE